MLQREILDGLIFCGVQLKNVSNKFVMVVYFMFVFR